MAGRYAIVGVGLVVGHTLPESATYTERLLETEAVRLAIEDAGLSRRAVDGAVHAKREGGPSMRQDAVDAFPRMLGLPVNFYYDVTRGGSAGILAIATAVGFLELGLAQYVAIAGGVADWIKKRRKQQEGTIQRGLGLLPRQGAWGYVFGGGQAPSFHSFLASRHMHEFGTTSEQLGMVAVQTRQWACLNPQARMYGRPMTLEDYLAAPFLVEPYRVPDMSLISDGAVGFIVTTLDRARDLARPPVTIAGVGFGEHMARLWWEKGNYRALPVASARDAAFGMAGITLADVDFAELYDCFTAEVILQLEDYGWCAKGDGGAFAASGAIGPGGAYPVNTYGGLLSAYHLADLGGIHEAVVQLRGEAGDRQVPGAEIGVVSGHGGEIVEPMCSIHSTLVLARGAHGSGAR